MKIIPSYISDPIAAILDSTTKVFTKVLPTLGSAVFQTTSIANDSVTLVRREMLIENKATINKLMKEANLTDEEAAEIEAQLAY